MTATQRSTRHVLDEKGTRYELLSEMSRGGQGVVYRTHLPNVLVKGFIHKDPDAKQRWHQHMAWLIRQDLNGLKLARPLALLEPPRFGYVMELMDGLVPLQSLLDSFIAAEHDAASDYLAQGGLRRRVRILCQLARTMNQLHGRGLLYGDLSPANIFVSDDPGFAETWLIDCDNISLQAHSGLTLHTPDYGAPEVVRGEAMLSSLTDCWSFAVIAYRLLTHNHPFKGELVEQGEPEEEDAALSGEHPWINDSDNPDNACFANLPMQLAEHSRLPALFRRCFEQGKHDATARPGIAEWLEALTEIDERIVVCAECTATSLMPGAGADLADMTCFFCDAPVDANVVLFEEFIFLPQEEKDAEFPELPDNRIATGRRVYLQQGATQELKRLMPSLSYDRWPTDHVRIEYTGKGLGIQPLPDGALYLQGDGDPKQLHKFQGLKAALRGQHDTPYQLHIGPPGESHVVWQFRW
jgi:DNA-binding helix-hairpin-helix protein with protein kinase domain